MKLRWTLPAQDDLRGQIAYIASRNPQAAEHMLSRVRRATAFIMEFPRGTRRSSEEDMREMVVNGTPFILVYTIEGNAVVILRMLHTAQQWPKK